MSAAKALLSLQVGISVGCVRIGKILHWLTLQDDEQYRIFNQFNRATAGLPIGNERLLWYIRHCWSMMRSSQKSERSSDQSFSALAWLSSASMANSFKADGFAAA